MSQEGRTIMLLEPVVPTSTVILRSTTSRGEDIASKMLPYLNKGYVVKSISTSSITNNGVYGFTLIVLEKY